MLFGTPFSPRLSITQLLLWNDGQAEWECWLGKESPLEYSSSLSILCIDRAFQPFFLLVLVAPYKIEGCAYNKSNIFFR